MSIAERARARADQPGGLRLLGIGAAAVAVTVWGASSVLIKEAEGATGLGIAFHRLWIGATGLTLVYLARGGRITWTFLRTCLPGGAAFALDIVLFFTAVQETTVTNATIVGALQPVLVMAIAPRLFGERRRWSDVMLGLVAIAGCALAVSGASAGDASTHGDLLAVGALLAWTWYFIASKRARAGLSSFEYLTGLSIVAIALMAPVGLLAHGELGAPTAKGWAIIALLALINGALGHILMNWAHGHVPIVITSLLTLAIPVVAAATAWLFIDERVTATQWIGMAVVICSLAVVVLRQDRGPLREPGATEPPAT
jgi:drug/metabolite transporter (DMT)-like permease